MRPPGRSPSGVAEAIPSLLRRGHGAGESIEGQFPGASPAVLAHGTALPFWDALITYRRASRDQQRGKVWFSHSARTSCRNPRWFHSPQGSRNGGKSARRAWPLWEVGGEATDMATETRASLARKLKIKAGFETSVNAAGVHADTRRRFSRPISDTGRVLSLPLHLSLSLGSPQGFGLCFE